MKIVFNFLLYLIIYFMVGLLIVIVSLKSFNKLFRFISPIVNKEKVISISEVINIPSITKVDTVNINSFDSSKAPSYIDPKQYHIIFISGYYVARFPHNTYIGTYSTFEEAQKVIIDLAKFNIRIWIGSKNKLNLYKE